MSKLSSLLPQPLFYRREIPFYHHKTEMEFKKDKYEAYNPTVINSCRKFYTASFGNQLLSELNKFFDSKEQFNVLELGCGTGFLIGKLAELNPSSNFLGLDYSYQMLKMAAQVFKNADASSLTKISDLHNGQPDMELQNIELHNVAFALSDACSTPLEDATIDFCFSCFLWDRVDDPMKLLKEKIRITKPGGTIMIITPLNYLHKDNWNNWFPITKMIEKIEREGLSLIHHDNFILEEYLDFSKNKVVWKAESLVFKVNP